jgi:mRNA interferase MazF
MMRGDVVILDHPFSDASGSKVRPALVVQNDRDNGRLTNTVVVLITKNTSRVNEPTQLLIDLGTAEGRQSGLHQTSAVVCTNLFTVSQVKILHVIGSLPAALMAQVNDRLKAALALP